MCRTTGVPTLTGQRGQLQNVGSVTSALAFTFRMRQITRGFRFWQPVLEIKKLPGFCKYSRVIMNVINSTCNLLPKENKWLR